MHTHQRRRYPIGWERIAKELKQLVGNCCQECDIPSTERTLTCAHVYPDDHDPSAEVVVVYVLCLHCHLRFDSQHAARKRRAYVYRYHMAMLPMRASELTPEDWQELAAMWPDLSYLERL